MSSTPAIVEKMNVLNVCLQVAHLFPLTTQMAGIRASWNVRTCQEHVSRERDRAARGMRQVMVSTSSKIPIITSFVTGSRHVFYGTFRMWGLCAAAATGVARTTRSI